MQIIKGITNALLLSSALSLSPCEVGRSKQSSSCQSTRQSETSDLNARLKIPVPILSTFAAFALASPAIAVSGGGLDYAGLDISGKNFNGSYKGKDFTQVIAKATNFKNSNLQGTRFYKSYLVKADFSGADIRGASFEDTSMDGANLKDAIAAGAYFSASIMDAASLENVDFTDAQLPVKTLSLVCSRSDVRGTNPTTGVDTRESLMCP